MAYEKVHLNNDKFLKVVKNAIQAIETARHQSNIDIMVTFEEIKMHLEQHNIVFNNGELISRIMELVNSRELFVLLSHDSTGHGSVVLYGVRLANKK